VVPGSALVGRNRRCYPLSFKRRLEAAEAQGMDDPVQVASQSVTRNI
jgi:hypothetical protein